MLKEILGQLDAETIILERDLPWIQEWSQIFQEADTYGYIKGGYVRDLVSNLVRDTRLEPKDVDLLVTGKINKVAGRVTARGGQIVERRRRKGTPVFRFKLPAFPETDFELGVALADSHSYGTISDGELRIQEAGRSDFDVNSMSIGLGNFDLVDPYGAVEAIQRGEMSLIDPRSLYRNPENILRGFKIKDKLGVNFSDDTKAQLIKHGAVLSRIKRPYLDSQMFPILTSANASTIWDEMTEFSVTQHLLQGQIHSLREAQELFAKENE